MNTRTARLTPAASPRALTGPASRRLDRQRRWAGTGGKTLKDLGYGFLGQYRRHNKDHINRLLDLGHHTCIADPLEPLLLHTALLYGRHHKGMPRWPVIVERIGILLADPAHTEWGQDGQGVRALAQMPPETPSPEGLTAALLSVPSGLPVTVLEWLSHHPLYCAAPHPPRYCPRSSCRLDVHPRHHHPARPWPAGPSLSASHRDG